VTRKVAAISIVQSDTPVDPSAHRRSRVITTCVGVALMCLAACPQLPFLNWTFTFGLSHGFDSGKSAMYICWTIVVLTIDLATLSTWLYFRPSNPGWVIVPPFILLAGMLVGILLAYPLWILIQILFL
jgi:hypothetical protein